jgi:hypothetical protein
MRKIKVLSVKRYRLLNVVFDDGRKGTYFLRDKFTGVALPLRNPAVFATAGIINNGSGVGFEGCEFDICAQLIYQELKTSRPARSRSRLADRARA